MACAKYAYHLALKDIEHWKWRAGVLQLKLSGVEETYELLASHNALVVSECSALQQQTQHDSAAYRQLQVCPEYQCMKVVPA